MFTVKENDLIDEKFVRIALSKLWQEIKLYFKAIIVTLEAAEFGFSIRILSLYKEKLKRQTDTIFF